MPDISPRLVKGAILVVDPNSGALRQTLTLQYNPDSITRSLKPQTPAEDADRSEYLRLKGPPIETIKCTVELDATDLLAAGDPVALAYGIQPQLALLELLVYPSTSILNTNETLTYVGTLEILPMEAGLTLFSWSSSRVTPVRITDLEITEEAFDPQLNPIRAKISLGMRVLNVNDVGFNNPAGSLYMTYQSTKESLAARAPGGLL